jgi:riboflavin transporter FmnP
MNGMNAASTMSKMTTQENTRKVKLLSARGLTAMALLSALATVLMLFDVPLFFLPNFYQVDFSEVPVLIGAFALGPVAGIVIELMKILINLVIQGSDTAGIGEIANFILGCTFVVPAAAIYHWKRSRKFAILGMGIGTVAFIAAGCLLNAYLLLPTYAKVFGAPIGSLIAVGTAVNPHINGMFTFILFAVAPFNLIKGLAVSIITILIYKYISPVIKGYHRNR